MSSSFYPATVGRVSTQQSITRLLFQVHADEGAIQKLQTQLSTGRRIERPSEDPGAAIRALAAQRSLEFKGQVLGNLQSANTVLGASEATLAQAQAVLNDMRGLAVESSGNLLSTEERTANADQIRNAIQRLVELGNSRFRDQYLFAGSDVNSPPLQVVGEAVRFSGTEHALDTITDIGATLAANIGADETFGTRSDHIVGTIDLNPALQTQTPLSDLNSGFGIRAGSIALSDGASMVEIDLSHAYSIEDVVNGIESQQLSGRDLIVNVTATGLTVDYADALGGTLRITEVGSGMTANDLGIRTSSGVSSAPVVGSDLNVLTTTQTRLSQLFGGAGIPNGSTFVIEQDGQDYTISTSGLTTVEDLINTIEASGARVRASLDASGKYFTIQSVESGTTLSIGEAGGTLATQLGVRTFDLGTPVSRLNFGQGIFTGNGSQDLKIQRTNGTTLSVDLSGVQSVGDVILRINSHVDNFTAGLRIIASLNPNGNGLVLTAPTGAQQIRIENAGGSQAAWGLGLVPTSQTSASGATVGTNSVLTGLDVSGIEVEGTFTTLLRLEDAVRSGDTKQMERLVNSLDADIQRLSLSRGVVGTRQQDVSNLQSRTEDQSIQLKELEANEIEADLATVISNLQSRQAALQASLQLMGQSSKMSLFDFI